MQVAQVGNGRPSGATVNSGSNTVVGRQPVVDESPVDFVPVHGGEDHTMFRCS